MSNVAVTAWNGPSSAAEDGRFQQKRPRQKKSTRAAKQLAATNARKQKMLNSVRGAKYVHVNTVDPAAVELCLKIMHTPAAETAFGLLDDSIFHGAVKLTRGDSKEQDPKYQDHIAGMLVRLGKKAHRWLKAIGFVPFKIDLDVESGLPMPFIPDPHGYEIHIIENTVSRKWHCALYFYANKHHQKAGYDPNVVFFEHRMPRINGDLTSAAMSLLFDYGLYIGRGQASKAHDRRVLLGEFGTQMQPADTSVSLQQTEHGIGTAGMDDYFDLNAETIRVSVANAQNTVATGNVNVTNPTHIVQANYDHLLQTSRDGGGGEFEMVANTRAHIVKTNAGERSIIQIPQGLDVVQFGTVSPSADLIMLGSSLDGKIAGVIGVPPASVSASVVAHGAGYEAIKEQLNGIACNRAALLTQCIQKAIDATFARNDEESIRTILLEMTENKLLKKTVPQLINQQRSSVRKRLGAAPLPPNSVEELHETIFVTAAEYKKRVLSNHLRVQLTPNVKHAADVIRDLEEVDGLISVNTRNEMLIQALNLSREMVEGDGGGVQHKNNTDKKAKATAKAKKERGEKEKKKEKGGERDTAEKRASKRAKTREKGGDSGSDKKKERGREKERQKERKKR